MSEWAAGKSGQSSRPAAPRRVEASIEQNEARLVNRLSNMVIAGGVQHVGRDALERRAIAGRRRLARTVSAGSILSSRPGTASSDISYITGDFDINPATDSTTSAFSVLSGDVDSVYVRDRALIHDDSANLDEFLEIMDKTIESFGQDGLELANHVQDKLSNLMSSMKTGWRSSTDTLSRVASQTSIPASFQRTKTVLESKLPAALQRISSAPTIRQNLASPPPEKRTSSISDYFSTMFQTGTAIEEVDDDGNIIGTGTRTSRLLRRRGSKSTSHLPLDGYRDSTEIFGVVSPCRQNPLTEEGDLELGSECLSFSPDNSAARELRALSKQGLYQKRLEILQLIEQKNLLLIQQLKRKDVLKNDIEEKMQTIETVQRERSRNSLTGEQYAE